MTSNSNGFTLQACYNVPDPSRHWPDAARIGPIPGMLWHIMTCLHGCNLFIGGLIFNMCTHGNLQQTMALSYKAKLQYHLTIYRCIIMQSVCLYIVVMICVVIEHMDSPVSSLVGSSPMIGIGIINMLTISGGQIRNHQFVSCAGFWRICDVVIA